MVIIEMQNLYVLKHTAYFFAQKVEKQPQKQYKSLAIFVRIHFFIYKKYRCKKENINTIFQDSLFFI